MTAYRNDNDPFCAAWLRNMAARGLIEEGMTDERSIEQVDSTALDGFSRCHFFAGIGGWEFALSLAEWPDDAEVWTGSPPCQSFSAARSAHEARRRPAKRGSS
jgi:DNA (cytosine-5)-methyltransferase 1